MPGRSVKLRILCRVSRKIDKWRGFTGKVCPLSKPHLKMSSSIQAEIDMYKYHIKIYHCIAASVIMIATCVTTAPIIFAITKIDSYGGYIIIATVTLYLICLLIIIAKWFLTVSEYKMRIRKKMEMMSLRNPLHRV